MTLERGKINGQPVWISSVDVSGGERTVLKEAPQFDGALVEVQGQEPIVYRIEYQLLRDGAWITDDVELAAADLRGVFVLGGPFEIELPGGVGVVSDLWFDGPWAMRPWDGQKGLIGGSASFVNARPFPEIGIDLRGAIDGAIQALAVAVIDDFGRRAPLDGFDDEGISALTAATDWLSRVQDAISTALGPVTSTLTAQIDALGQLVSAVTGAPYSFALQFCQIGASLLALVPALADDGASASTGDGSSDTAGNVLVDVLVDAAGFDDDVVTQAAMLGAEASEEDLAAKAQVDSVVELTMSVATMAVCYAAKSTSFATADAVASFASALQPVLDKLLTSPTVDYRVYSAARYTWLATMQLLAEEAARLPRLVSFTVAADTDALSLMAELYPTTITGVEQLERAVEQFLRINRVADPTAIPAGQVVRILQGAT